jgi:hypothetical protein
MADGRLAHGCGESKSSFAVLRLAVWGGSWSTGWRPWLSSCAALRLGAVSGRHCFGQWPEIEPDHLDWSRIWEQGIDGATMPQRGYNALRYEPGAAVAARGPIKRDNGLFRNE